MALNGRLARYTLRTGLLGVSLYYAVWGGEYSAPDLRRLDAMQAQEDAYLAVARERVDSLRARAERLDRDPVEIERVARERFGMIRSGETLYRFVHVDTPRDGVPRVAVSP